ncbi:hypothetical protein [Streptomyces sp. NBC_00233]|uniref:hypothetical protein n=1 Tax=Streptomyces sp. NBC_00233 TaxID=2975686 RepID=UPI002255A10C|nr:hypothetical protein [Streptomyces sp. NBC_00233]MCX5232608.1 hypothetical protein [Streptomyces sp. NBC_00233]
MVETVLQILQQMASGSLTVVGTEVGQAVFSAVRERFVGTDAGRDALTALEERPEDAASADQVRALLLVETDTDPAFAERLSALLSVQHPLGPARVTTGSITFEGTTLRGNNTISLGPVSISNTRTTRWSLVAAAVALVALVVLGVYGGAQLVNPKRGSGDSGGSGQPAAAATTATAGPVGQESASPDAEPAVTGLSVQVLRSILPAPEDVVPRLVHPSEPYSFPYSTDTPDRIASALTFYKLLREDGPTISFTVTSYTDTAHAEGDFTPTVEQVRHADTMAVPGSPQWTTEVPKTPSVGNQSWMGISTLAQGPEGGRMSLVVRSGSLIIHINIRSLPNGSSNAVTNAFSIEDLNGLGRMMAARAGQAQSGLRPNIRLGDV